MSSACTASHSTLLPSHSHSWSPSLIDISPGTLSACSSWSYPCYCSEPVAVKLHDCDQLGQKKSLRGGWLWLGSGKRCGESLNSEAVQFGDKCYPWQYYITRVISHQYLSPLPKVGREKQEEGRGGEGPPTRAPASGLAWKG